MKGTLAREGHASQKGWRWDSCGAAAPKKGAAGLKESRMPSQPDRSRVPGIVIDHSPAASQRYIGSPSLARLPDGSYVASHDFFGPGTTYNQVRIHRSADAGRTWEAIAEIDGQFWSTLFWHQGALYLMGTSGQYGYGGQAIIRCSTDGGATWTAPTDARHGLLLPEGQHHCAPVPVVVHHGRIWRAMEDRDPPEGWGSTFRAFVMSAPADADLLRAESWRCTNRLRYDPSWPGNAWLEGNVVVTLDGHIVNILRNDLRDPGIPGERAAVVRVSDDGARASFDPETGFIDFPGGCKKFTIRRDPGDGLYWSLTNWVHPDDVGGNPERTRNTLALISSPDLADWSVRSILLRHTDMGRTGFQYVDWLFEGDDIVAVSRTAYDDGLGGAHNCHDANYMTFHRVPSFRRRTVESPLLS
jgi:hypothetical protein